MSKKRSEVAENLKWRLTDIFKDQKEFDDLLENISGKVDFSAYEGKLADEKTLLKCLKEMDEVETVLEKLDVYAYMKKDLDARDSESNALLTRVENVIISYSSSTSFITPEITSIPDEKLEKIIADPDFKDYDYMLRNLLKSKKTRSFQGERERSRYGRTSFRRVSRYFRNDRQRRYAFPDD